MSEPQNGPLRGRRLLIVEDNYLIAADLAWQLESSGADFVGMAGSVSEAHALIEAEGDVLDGAILDVNLGSEQAFPVADTLLSRKIPFVFATGYDQWVLPEAYANIPRCEKPVRMAALIPLLLRV
jgi:CheY-like chemotaxis protein